MLQLQNGKSEARALLQDRMELERRRMTVLHKQQELMQEQVGILFTFRVSAGCVWMLARTGTGVSRCCYLITMFVQDVLKRAAKAPVKSSAGRRSEVQEGRENTQAPSNKRRTPDRQISRHAVMPTDTSELTLTSVRKINCFAPRHTSPLHRFQRAQLAQLPRLHSSRARMPSLPVMQSCTK